MKIESNENVMRVSWRELPPQKYGEIHGKHGTYTVYLSLFEQFPDRLVYQMEVPSLKLGHQYTQYGGDINLPSHAIAREMFALIEETIKGLNYA